MIQPTVQNHKQALKRLRPTASPERAGDPSLRVRMGIGPFHTLMVPGLVPDGEETFLRVRSHFLLKGDVSVLTYPYATFDAERMMATFDAFMETCRRTRKKPILVGVSVGGGFLLEHLRRSKERGEALEPAAIVLVSPLSCPQDLAPVLRRLWNPIVA